MKSTVSFPPPGYLIFTSNGGITWQNIEYGEQNYIISLDFIDIEHGAISIAEKGVSFTSDGGLTWTVPTTVNGYVPDFVEYINDSALLVCNGANMLAMTTHANNNWEMVIENNGGMLFANDYFFISEKKGWLVGGAGMIMQYSNPLLNIFESDISADVDIAIYPNPVDNILFIEHALCLERIVIADMQGRVLHQINKPDNHSVDVSFLTSGTYILSIGTNDGSQSFLFVKK